MNEKNIKLVIAEKPSVAQSIAKVIGADKREDGYLEGNGYVVSWCVGHLVELASPESYDEKYEKWRYEDLPILPSEWNYQIAEATRKQFGILKKLMEREDVTGLVEATDAGREGELIFRLVYDQAKCKKPFERLWISSMEDQAISDGFSNLKNGREYDDLYRAALCRERADWIVGMNATRLFSTLYGQTLNVGRVMTPTLAMIVQREAEIDGFKPESIYRLSISCGGITALSDRFEKKQDAENILNMLKEQKSAQVTKINPADKQEKAPQLYSLTALQRDASRFLTEDMESMIPDLAGKMAAKFGYTRKMVVHPKQVINNSKVSDHHAIIPTVNVADKVLRSCFRQAVKWDMMEKNPAVDATVPKAKKQEREIWTAEMLMQALEACDNKMLKIAFHLAFTATLRIGEVLGLTWDAMDISEEAIAANRAYVYINKEVERVSKQAVEELNSKDIILIFPSQKKNNKTVRVLKSPKTDSSKRKVFIPKSVAQCLIELKKDQEEIIEALGNEYQNYNLVMATTFGLPIGDSYLRTKMQDIIDELGLPDVVFHSLRHTSVTYKLKLSGGDIKAVQGDSGHAQADMVTEVYGHILDEDRRKNAELMENAFYNKENLNPQMKNQDEGNSTITVPDGVDAELLMKVLGNPEMAALLTSLAKTMKV